MTGGEDDDASRTHLRLVEPTDFEILAFLDEHGRNNAVNVAAAIDRDRSYINTRLSELKRQDLLDHVGPAPNSGLYELNDRGEAAVEHRDRHGDPDVDFLCLVDAATDDNSDD
ncbi:winged helix-turn-helix domain-containing protein [Halocalculus aciditolerans]|uniref:Uncharacterized protein n=1 Tax=Halocalculus aciditolerans TaxID=1383812 RepID=A0A830FEN9_9EURY|nr:winged helix-turn-helix domain-containing protein [Halocalculus aciditolerans]GGL47658.1 hypothetical protein GCM10009039_02370 [Halocalculus aciditolerans]